MDPEQHFNKRCPAHEDGAHRFVAEPGERDDEYAVRVCHCGEVELSPDDQLALIEASQDTLQNRLPPERALTFYTKILDMLEARDPQRFAEEFGDKEAYLQRLVNGVERPPT